MALNEATYRQFLAVRQGGTFANLIPDLTELWCQDYRQTHGTNEIVSVTQPSHGTSFTYLFDIPRSRIVVAYGIPIYNQLARDASRQKGHPLGATETTKYVRGHLMAHVFGGGMDINFVPQLRSTNGSAFKKVENEVRELAKAHTRCLYFVRTLYGPQPVGQALSEASQLPVEIEQAVIHASGDLTYRMHNNL